MSACARIMNFSAFIAFISLLISLYFIRSVDSGSRISFKDIRIVRKVQPCVGCQIHLKVCLVKYSSKSNCMMEIKTELINNDTKTTEAPFGSIYTQEMMKLKLTVTEKGLDGKEKDILLAKGQHKLGFVNSTWQALTFADDKYDFSLQYKVQCKLNMYGKTCDKICQPTDSRREGHYTCDWRGRETCMDGWMTPEGVSYPICSSRTCKKCIRGKCNKVTLSCICDERWTGEKCDTEICRPPCMNGGICGGGACKCKKPYYGMFCAMKIEPSTSITSSTHVNSTRIISPTQKLSILTTSIQMRLSRLSASTKVKQSVKSSPVDSDTVTVGTAEKSSRKKSVSRQSTVVFYSSVVFTTNSPGEVSTTNTKVKRTTPSGDDGKKNEKLAISLTIALLITFIIVAASVWLLWKRSKLRHRKRPSPRCAIVTPTSTPPNMELSYGTTTSKTPVLSQNFCNEIADATDCCDEIISSVVIGNKKAENNNVDTSQTDLSKYTIESMDKMFREVIRAKPPKTEKKNNSKQQQQQQQQQSNSCCSSGYCSNSSPSIPSSANSERSFRPGSGQSAIPHNGSDLSRCTIDMKELSDLSSVAERATTAHPAPRFEGLPNFVVYQDEEDQL